MASSLKIFLLAALLHLLVTTAVGDKTSYTALSLLGLAPNKPNCRPGINGPTCQNIHAGTPIFSDYGMNSPNLSPLGSPIYNSPGLHDPHFNNLGLHSHSNYHGLGLNPNYNSLGSGRPGLVSGPGGVTTLGMHNVGTPGGGIMNRPNIYGRRPGMGVAGNPGYGVLNGPVSSSVVSHSGKVVVGPGVRHPGFGGIHNPHIASYGEPVYSNYDTLDTRGIGYNRPGLMDGVVYEDLVDTY